MKTIIVLISILTSINFSQQKKIFIENSLVKLFAEGFFTEGPAQAPDGSVYFSDLTFTDATDMLAGVLWRYIPSLDTTVVYRSPSGMSNGIAFDKEGSMIVCESSDFGGRRVTKTDMKTGKSKIIAGLFNGKPFNSPNDLIIDSEGRIYFTDPKYGGYEPVEQPVTGVYRIETDGQVKLIISDIAMPNGITLSPSEKELYVACNYEGDEKRKPQMCIYRFKLKEGKVSAKENFINLPDDSAPDGLAVDNEGNLYAAIRNEENPVIKVYNDKGEEIDSLPLPEVPSNLTFGRGEDSNTLFITAGGSLYKALADKRGVGR